MGDVTIVSRDRSLRPASGQEGRFIDGVRRGTEATLVNVIIRLGAAMRLDVVAEGIELPEQAATLAHLKCPRGQGYYFAPPLEAAQLEPLLGRTLPDMVELAGVPTPMAPSLGVL